MTENEQLREALLELKILRDREAELLQETRALLSCIEAYSAATGPDAAIGAIFDAACGHLGATLAVLVTPSAHAGQGYDVVAASAPWAKDTHLDAPIDLMRRSRNLADLHLAGRWGGGLALSDMRSMLVAPNAAPVPLTGAPGDASEEAPGGVILLALHPQEAWFTRAHLDFGRRLVGLAARALQNRAMEAENALLAATIEGSSAGFAIADATRPERPLIYVNDAFEKLSGYRRHEVLGQNCRFLSAESAESPERARLRDTVAANGKGRFLLHNRRRDGSLFWNELSLFPVLDPDRAIPEASPTAAAPTSPRVRYLVASQSDVTDRVEAAEARDRAQAMMETSLEASQQAFLILDAEGRVQFANPATAEFFPAPGTDWAAGVPFHTHWRAYCAGTRALPGRLTRLVAAGDIDALVHVPKGRELDLPDGRAVLVKASRLADGAMVLTATDVTAMKVAQRLLSQRLAAIEAAEDGIALVDPDGRLTFVNSSAARLLGFARQGDALGRRWQAIYDAGAPPHTTRPFARRMTRKAAPESAATPDKDTPRARSHDVTGTPLDNGGAVIVIRDATDRVAAEARAADLTRALARAQRQQAVADLTAGVAHDFNNLLSAVTGSAALIELEAGDADAVRGHAERIGVAGRRAGRLINRLLDMGDARARQGRFDLATALSEMPALVTPSLPEGIGLRVPDLREPVLLRGDLTDLSQVLVNLLLNARDAMEDRAGEIVLEVAVMVADGTQTLRAGRLRKGGRYARLAVSDRGHGMDAATIATIFEPYFSTKGARGTGLGLAVVAMQLEAVGGAVEVQSTPGAGTTFVVFWPLADASAKTGPDALEGALEGTPDAEADADAAHGAGAVKDLDLSGLTILLVDDERAVADVAQAYLESLGAEVAACHDPRDALEVLRDDPVGWSVLVTDYDMPYLTGGDLVAAVRGFAPDLPVVVITALARRLSDARVARGQVSALLPKPLDLDALALAVAASVTHRRPGPVGPAEDATGE